MKRLHRALATLSMLCLASAARAFDTAPASDPEALGFSSSRLARIVHRHLLSRSGCRNPSESDQFRSRR